MAKSRSVSSASHHVRYQSLVLNIKLSNGFSVSKKTPLEIGVLFISAICTLCVLGWFVWFMRFGIDFADEGFYLNWISNPFNYKASLTQFGFIYHPLFRVVSGDVVLLRQINLLSTFFLAFTLVIVFLYAVDEAVVLDVVSKVVASAAIAVSSLCFYRNWIPTPNYNFLSFQSLMLAMIGMLLIQRNEQTKSLTGWLLLGFAGWLAFMAKPTTAAALAGVSVVYLIASGKFNVKLALISFVFILLLFLLSAIVIDNSVFGFFNRVVTGFEQAQLLSPDYDFKSVVRVDSFSLTLDELFYLIAGAFFVVLFLGFSEMSTRLSTGIWIALYLSISIFTILTLNLSAAFFTNTLWIHLLMLVFPLGGGVFFLINRQKSAALLGRFKRHWSILLPLVVFPYVFAFGTGGNYWFFYGLVSLFWIIGSLFLFDPVNRAGKAYPIISFGFMVQLIVPLIVFTAIEDPYYQPSSLRKDDYIMNFGLPDSKLTLPTTYGRYVSDATEVASRGGYVAGTPMIDLTGRSPGLLYALGASSLGAAWMYGNYINTTKNSEIYAVEVLGGVACDDLARAWILLEPQGRVSLSTIVLQSFGAISDQHYEVVGAFKSPNSAGGFVASDQILLKPNRSIKEAEVQCIAHRQAPL